MKAKVTRAFYDMQDPARTVYQVGATYEGTQKRIEDLEKKGFVKGLSGRPTKADMLEEIKETKTNPEIAEMLGKEPPKKRVRKDTAKNG